MVSLLRSPITSSIHSACFLRFNGSSSVPIGEEISQIWIWFVRFKNNNLVLITCPCGTDLFSARNRRSSTPFSTLQFTSLASSASSAIHHRRRSSGFHHASPTNQSEARHQHSGAGYEHRSMTPDLPSATSPLPSALKNHHRQLNPATSLHMNGTRSECGLKSSRRLLLPPGCFSLSLRFGYHLHYPPRRTCYSPPSLLLPSGQAPPPEKPPPLLTLPLPSVETNIERLQNWLDLAHFKFYNPIKLGLHRDWPKLICGLTSPIRLRLHGPSFFHYQDKIDFDDGSLGNFAWMIVTDYVDGSIAKLLLRGDDKKDGCIREIF